jgi:hypothetical protein
MNSLYPRFSEHRLFVTNIMMVDVNIMISVTLGQIHYYYYFFLKAYRPYTINVWSIYNQHMAYIYLLVSRFEPWFFRNQFIIFVNQLTFDIVIKSVNITYITNTLHYFTNQTSTYIFYFILFSNKTNENIFLKFFQWFTHV